MNETSKQIHRLISLPVLLALFYIVCMTPLMGRKHGYTVDATPSFQVTKSIVETGVWFSDTSVKQGYLYSVIYLPFYLLGSALSTLLPNIEPDWLRRKCMCWMNTVFTGCTLAFISLTLRRLRFSLRAQIWIPLFYGFSTMAFNYARYDYNKCLAALLLSAVFYELLTTMQTPKKWTALLCGLATGLLLAVRVELIVIFPFFLYGLIPQGKNKKDWFPIITYIVLAITGVAWVFLYNFLYWRGGVAGGYEGGFQANPFPGLLGFLFSPGKNIWIFNPVLLLMPLTIRPFRRAASRAFLPWTGAVLAIFLLYSFWGNWWGGWGWGPRHLVPLLPLLILPLATLVDSESRNVRTLAMLLFLVGVYVQCLGALVDFNDVILTLTQNQITEPELIWNPLWNAVLQHSLVMGQLPVLRWDFGWIGLSQTLSITGFLGMLILWIGLLGILGFLIFQQHESTSPTIQPEE